MKIVMRNVFNIAVIFVIINIFSGTAFGNVSDTTSKVVIDTLEYEIIVFDPGYESYLLSQPPMDFYSMSYYKSWNTLYTFEWNNRYISQSQTGLYESTIEYDSSIDYDLELEYKLYYFFRFFEKENNIILIQRGK